MGLRRGPAAGAPAAGQLPTPVAQGMSRSTEDCCKMQGPCSSSARPACAPATGIPPPGDSPAQGAWDHHDGPGVPMAKLWVLLGDELPWGSPQDTQDQASTRDGDESPWGVPMAPSLPRGAGEALVLASATAHTKPRYPRNLPSTSLPGRGDSNSCRKVSVTAGASDNCLLDRGASRDTSPLLSEAASANDGKTPASSASLGACGTQLLGG